MLLHGRELEVITVMILTFGVVPLRAVPGAAAWQGGHHCDDPYLCLWCCATIDSIARTWIGNAHSITIARELQSSLRSAHT